MAKRTFSSFEDWGTSSSSPNTSTPGLAEAGPCGIGVGSVPAARGAAWLPGPPHPGHCAGPSRAPGSRRGGDGTVQRFHAGGWRTAGWGGHGWQWQGSEGHAWCWGCRGSGLGTLSVPRPRPHPASRRRPGSHSTETRQARCPRGTPACKEQRERAPAPPVCGPRRLGPWSPGAPHARPAAWSRGRASPSLPALRPLPCLGLLPPSL